MYVQHMFVVLLLYACSVDLFGANAYPALLPYLYNPTNDVRATATKRNKEATFMQIEDDVGELEALRQPLTIDTHMEATDKRNADATDVETTSSAVDANSDEEIIVPAEVEVINHSNTLPDLERQLELATPIISTTTAASATAVAAAGSASKEEMERPQLETEAKQRAQMPVVDTPAPPMGKAFYGAARLAFGQNPEIIPTSSTTTTTTTTTAAAAATTTGSSNNTVADSAIVEVATTTVATVAPPVAVPEQPIKPIISDIVGDNIEGGDSAVSELSALETVKIEQADKQHLNKETVGDIPVDKLDTVKTTERRSSMQLSPKTAQSLLRNPNGQYSSFDMAQYVFWTGDEAGVARAVEELIDENLISRDNALKFLRDIRLGIEFLQRSYANRIFPEELRQNHLKRNNPPTTTTTSTTTTTTSTTTEQPMPYVQLEQDAEHLLPEVENELHLSKTLDSYSFWNKLRELNNEGRQDLTDYDDAAGRAKIVEYLYNEYTLEEILYKLAKVMFMQSLAHGSDEAQQEMQKLTDFLEREGNLGVIPIDLQKKVLHVLLTALSDTLTEHPELLPAARLNLANPYYRLPIHTPSH